jgi:prepilin-type processing-associated H-X9-DG protein/prepilin-type N-terminal cleavage/methylation domain-containing protein
MSKSFFTLLELLIVIAVIAVLASLLLPALNKAKETAKNIQCQGNLKQIGIAVYLYTDESHGYLPYGDGASLPAWGERPDVPLAKLLGYENMSYSDFQNKNTVFKCPSCTYNVTTSHEWIDWMNYCANAICMPYEGHGTSKYATLRKIERIPNPSKIILIADKQTVFHLLVTETSYLERLAYWHANGLNALFADGHVAWKKYYDITPEEIDFTQ